MLSVVRLSKDKGCLKKRKMGNTVQELFHVCLNNFEIVVTHIFSLYFVIFDLHRLV